MPDKLLRKDIQALQKGLIGKLGWMDSEQWHSAMFDELSAVIFEKTNILLSITTLKRFFNVVQYDGTPSITTLNALSVFMGFENWTAFRHSRRQPKKIVRRGITDKSFYISVGFVIAIFTVVLVAGSSSETINVPKDVLFTSQPLTNSYPNSVVFEFDLNGIDHEDLKIQQYWDETKTFAITKDQKTATGIYYFPGYFRAKLVVGDSVIKEHDLFLKSDGWLGTLEYEPVPKYFEPIRTESSYLTYPEDLMTEVSSSGKPLVSVYHFIDELGDVSGDRFALTATMQSRYSEKWAVCQDARLYIIATDGAMIIPFSKLGCSANNSLMLNDVYKGGDKNDLSMFAADLSEPTDIRLQVMDKNVEVHIDDQMVYSGSYQESMGRLVGVRFKFLGLGEVKNFDVRSRGKIVNF